MQVEKRDGSIERRVLTGMLVSRDVLGRIADKWVEEGLFQSRWSNLVGSWCCEYYQKYGKAPRQSIEGLFQAWASNGATDETTVDLIERFLESLSGEYQQLKRDINAEYILDVAGEYFNRVRLSRLAEIIQGHLDTNKVNDALESVVKFDHIHIGKDAGIDVLQDAEAMRQAFEMQMSSESGENLLVSYPGALGAFFRDALERDGFIAFVGPEKRGKTFWLLDVAWRAMRQGRRVAFIEVGDMSESQIMRRFGVRASRRPLKATPPDRPVRYPIALDHAPDSKTSNVQVVDKHFENDLTWEEATAACQRVMTKQGTDESLLRLSCHANSSIGVAGINTLLQTWQRQGWGPPDVVIIDYADLLVPPVGFRDSRDQHNATWKQLRALSQTLHCLVVTATQSDTDSYKRDTMSMANFSEDKRKNAHVTGMVGINQTLEEKRLGLQRLNWLVLRESEFTSSDVVHVAGCLAIANPAVISSF